MTSQLALFAEPTPFEAALVKTRAALGEHFASFCTWCGYGNRFYTYHWLIRELGFTPDEAEQVFQHLKAGGA